MQEARNHHFVPKLLLRPWLKQDSTRQLHLCGYYWDERRKGLSCKQRGLNSFCCQIDLLALKSRQLERDAIERIFFGEVDTKGAIARDALLQYGPKAITNEQRADFVRLLISLEARRPPLVERIKRDFKQVVEALNSAPEIVEAFAREGINETPSDYYERTSGIATEDRALALVEKLTDSPKVHAQIIRSHWGLIQLGSSDGSFVLADRPLIRVHAYDSPGAVWILPLTPKSAFIAVNHQENLSRILLLSKFQICRNINVSSAMQAERFVFSTEVQASIWLGKYLDPLRRRLTLPSLSPSAT